MTFSSVKSYCRKPNVQYGLRGRKSIYIKANIGMKTHVTYRFIQKIVVERILGPESPVELIQQLLIFFVWLLFFSEHFYFICY